MAPLTDSLAGVAAANLEYTRGPLSPAARIGLWLVRLAGQIRRQYLCRFRPAYVARMKASRRGECRRCGSCCNLTYHCPFLKRDGDCRIYRSRTLTCRDFPIDAVDLRLTRVPCGLHFDPPTVEPRKARPLARPQAVPWQDAREEERSRANPSR
jgi:hypothetical protein